MSAPTIYHNTTRTRSSKLHEHPGDHQDGSIKVRSEGHRAADPQPGKRLPEGDGNDEDDYFNELDSPNLIKRGDSPSTVFDSDHVGGSSPSPSSSSPEQRLFGDEPEPEEMVREPQEPKAEKSETPVKFEARSPQLNPLENLASVIKPARLDPVQDLPGMLGLALAPNRARTTCNYKLWFTQLPASNQGLEGRLRGCFLVGREQGPTRPIGTS